MSHIIYDILYVAYYIRPVLLVLSILSAYNLRNFGAYKFFSERSRANGTLILYRFIAYAAIGYATWILVQFQASKECG